MRRVSVPAVAAGCVVRLEVPPAWVAEPLALPPLMDSHRLPIQAMCCDFRRAKAMGVKAAGSASTTSGGILSTHIM